MLLTRNIRLVNSPAEFQTAEEFDRYYPFITNLTCRSIIATTSEEAKQGAAMLGYPVFVKGTVQSFKKWGWSSCVAENETTLENLFANLYRSEARSLGKVIIRELILLKYTHKTGSGFPQGREFRVFLLYNQVIAYSYYWSQDDPLQKVTPAEETCILSLARQAAMQINVPYIAIDIGQKQTGEWVVIEAGDAQFSGICQISPIALWQRIDSSFH